MCCIKLKFRYFFYLNVGYLGNAYARTHTHTQFTHVYTYTYSVYARIHVHILSLRTYTRIHVYIISLRTYTRIHNQFTHTRTHTQFTHVYASRTNMSGIFNVNLNEPCLETPSMMVCIDTYNDKPIATFMELDPLLLTSESLKFITKKIFVKDILADNQYVFKNIELLNNITEQSNFSNQNEAIYAYVVILIVYESASIMQRYIENIDYFYEFCLIADKLLIDFNELTKCNSKLLWLIDVQERQKPLWVKNAMLLHAIETKEFLKPKFPANASASASVNASATPNFTALANAVPSVPSDYPGSSASGNSSTSSPTVRDININTIKYPHDVDMDILASVMEIMIEHNNIEFVNKLIVVFGTSIEYSRMFIGNPNIVKIVKDFAIFDEVIKYIIRIMYLEERSFYNHIGAAGDYIIDISTACLLEHTYETYFTENPYFPLRLFKYSYNGLNVTSALKGQRGIYSLDEFQTRMEIFTHNALKHIKWSTPKAKTILNGSVMLACAVKNPLETNISFEAYLDEYFPRESGKYKTTACIKKYPIVRHNDTQELLVIEKITNHMTCNANASNASNASNTSSANAGINANAASAVHPINSNFADIDLMIVCEWSDFDSVAEEHFANIQKVFPNAKLIKTPTENKHKYSIENIPRHIDMFHTIDCPSVIVKFHLGCVRAWYDGVTVHCMPTFIIAAMTGLNVDVRWTSNRKDVRDIVLKYFQRGYGTVMNRDDEKSILAYTRATPAWSSINKDAFMSYFIRFNDHKLFFNPNSAFVNGNLTTTYESAVTYEFINVSYNRSVVLPTPINNTLIQNFM